VKCAICGRECHEGFLHLGGYCGEEHRREVLARHRRLLDELRREDVRALPESLVVPDFERLALKLAVHLLAGLGPELLERYRREAPWLLDPLAMALELKERILRQLPGEYVTLQEAVGHQRFFHGGTYSFKQPVPSRLVVEAMARANLVSIPE
jgi:hypothetical protein